MGHRFFWVREKINKLDISLGCFSMVLKYLSDEFALLKYNETQTHCLVVKGLLLESLKISLL